MYQQPPGIQFPLLCLAADFYCLRDLLRPVIPNATIINNEGSPGMTTLFSFKRRFRLSKALGQELSYCQQDRSTVSIRIPIRQIAKTLLLKIPTQSDTFSTESMLLLSSSVRAVLTTARTHSQATIGI